MPRPHHPPARRRRPLLAGALLALAAVTTACPPGATGTPAAPAGPSPERLHPFTPAGISHSARPLSADGRFVAYASFSDDHAMVAQVYDRVTGVTHQPVAPTDDPTENTFAPYVSGDGSTVWFTTRRHEVFDGRPNDGHALMRLRTATGELDQIDLPSDGWFDGKLVGPVATSHDGAVAAAEVGDLVYDNRVVVWTESGGFTTLVRPTPPGYQQQRDDGLGGVGISENGRWVAVVGTLWDSFHNTRRHRIDVVDRQTGAWTLAWRGSELTPSDHWGAERPTVLAVLDDGSLLMDLTSTIDDHEFAVSRGIVHWERATTTATQELPEDPRARAFGASADGRFVGYTGSDVVGTPSPSVTGTAFLLDRTTEERLPAGQRSSTRPVAVSADGGVVLLDSLDPTAAALNPPGSGDNRLFLWDRPSS